VPMPGPIEELLHLVGSVSRFALCFYFRVSSSSYELLDTLGIEESTSHE